MDPISVKKKFLKELRGYSKGSLAEMLKSLMQEGGEASIKLEVGKDAAVKPEAPQEHPGECMCDSCVEKHATPDKLAALVGE